jgi:hypothetical protein
MEVAANWSQACEREALVHVTVVAEADGDGVKKRSVAMLVSSSRHCHDTCIWWALSPTPNNDNFTGVKEERKRKLKKERTCHPSFFGLYRKRKDSHEVKMMHRVQTGHEVKEGRCQANNSSLAGLLLLSGHLCGQPGPLHWWL